MIQRSRTVSTAQNGAELGAHGTGLLPVAAYDNDYTEREAAWHWHRELELIRVAEGRLRVDQLRAMFSVMPFDIAFVDDTDTIRFFGGNCGFYPHSKNDLGMNLFSIHMPKSVSKVKQIVDDLRTGKKDKHEFWFEIRGRFVYIQYLAVRNKAGEYLGVLEVLQDATYVRSLKGSKKDL